MKKQNSRVPKWKESDSIDCLDLMVNCGMKAAMSEFDHPTILKEAKKRGLNVIIIGERANIKNRRIEILITNYNVNQVALELN